MTRNLGAVRAAVLTGALLWSIPAGATTILFTGVVASVPLDDLYGDINSGAAIQGSFIYDPAATDLAPGDPTVGSYTSAGAPFGMTVTIAGHVFTAADSINLAIFDGIVDQYLVTAFGEGGNLTLELFLQDNSGTAFSDDSLSAIAPPPALFTILDFHLHEVGNLGETQVDGSITDLGTAAEVPEPSTAALLLAGLYVLVKLRRRFQCPNREASC